MNRQNNRNVAFFSQKKSLKHLNKTKIFFSECLRCAGMELNCASDGISEHYLDYSLSKLCNIMVFMHLIFLKKRYTQFLILMTSFLITSLLRNDVIVLTAYSIKLWISGFVHKIEHWSFYDSYSSLLVILSVNSVIKARKLKISLIIFFNIWNLDVLRNDNFATKMMT